MPALHRSVDGHDYPLNQSERSTKKQSKQRRDLINAEVNLLRDLLPFSTNTRNRLSQLQLMACVCVYMRKCTYLSKVNREVIAASVQAEFTGQNNFWEFEKCLHGCLLTCRSDGQLLYVGENAAQVLGYDLEDLVSLGDNLYDILDKKDRKAVDQTLHMDNCNFSNIHSSGNTDKQSFLARVVAQRNMKKQGRPVDQKVILVEGYFMSYPKTTTATYGDVNSQPDRQPLFVAICQAVLNSDNQHLIAGESSRFCSTLHQMDMTIRAITMTVSQMPHMVLLGDNLIGTSWYQLIHWDDIKAARKLHALICQNDGTDTGLVLLRLQSTSGWQWCHVSLSLLPLQSSSLQQSNDSKQPPNDLEITSQRTSLAHGRRLSSNRQILATYQMLTTEEARLFQATKWLYDQPNTNPVVTTNEQIKHLTMSSAELQLSRLKPFELEALEKAQSVNQSSAVKRKLTGKSDGHSLRALDVGSGGEQLNGASPTKMYCKWRKHLADDEKSVVTVPTALSGFRSSSSPSDEEQHVPNHYFSPVHRSNNWPVYFDGKNSNHSYRSHFYSTNFSQFPNFAGNLMP